MVGGGGGYEGGSSYDGGGYRPAVSKGRVAEAVEDTVMKQELLDNH